MRFNFVEWQLQWSRKSAHLLINVREAEFQQYTVSITTSTILLAGGGTHSAAIFCKEVCLALLQVKHWLATVMYWNMCVIVHLLRLTVRWAHASWIQSRATKLVTSFYAVAVQPLEYNQSSSPVQWLDSTSLNWSSLRTWASQNIPVRITML